MLNHLRKLFGQGSETTTREVAKQRLSMVIMIDRGVLPKDMLDKLQRDIRDILKKYPIFDLQHLVIEMQDEERGNRQRVQIVVPIKKNPPSSS